jgi:peptide/nickel transport system ATP-binding protein
MSVLAVKNLGLTINGKSILKDVSFTLEPGKVMALVGESGSGKSLTALSIMQLLPRGSKTSGSIQFASAELLNASEEDMCALRGDDIGMVFQEPMTALNPLKTIGEQVAEGIRIHARVNHEQAEKRATEILERVGLPVSRYPLSRYPHELSGGQRQRVVIAMACAMQPKLLIADEPTTALDVIVQAKILKLLEGLVANSDMALLLISHDLGVVAGMADDIVILRKGEVMEQGEAVPVLKRRRHAYTRQLAEASSHVPKRRIGWKQTRTSHPLVEVRDLVCEYPVKRTSIFRRSPPFRAVNQVSLTIQPGEILGLVGESGCGKSTLARCLLGLIEPASGSIHFEGESDLANHRTRPEFAQAVFQDPYGSFNPRHKAERLVAEPLYARKGLGPAQTHEMIVEAMEDVGMSASDLDKFPHEFSGGQRQRLAIARAIVNHPRLIIADEPVSALDVSIRSQILDLIIELRERLDIAFLFVSHDLSVVRALCDNVLIMQNGRVIEHGQVDRIYDHPEQAYTKALIDAAPNLEKALERS